MKDMSSSSGKGMKIRNRNVSASFRAVASVREVGNIYPLVIPCTIFRNRRTKIVGLE